MNMDFTKAKTDLCIAHGPIKTVEQIGPMWSGLDMYPDLRLALLHLEAARAKLDRTIASQEALT